MYFELVCTNLVYFFNKGPITNYCYYSTIDYTVTTVTGIIFEPSNLNSRCFYTTQLHVISLCFFAERECQFVVDQAYCAKVGQCPGGKCVAAPNGLCQCATINLIDDLDKTPFATKPRPGSVDT